MLKKLSKRGEYMHLLIISAILLLIYFTPPVSLPSVSGTYATPAGIWISQKVTLFPFATKIILLLFMVFISFYLNRQAAAKELFPRQSFISATLLMVLFLYTSNLLTLAYAVSLIALLTFCLSNIINIFGKQYPYVQVLNASMSVALASMVMPQAILFMLFIWFAFFTYSVSSWREWVISVIGLIIPYLYMFFGYFWNDNLEYVFRLFQSYTFQELIMMPELPLYQLIPPAIILLLYISGGFYFTNEASDKIITIRKRMWLIFQFSLITLIVIVLTPGSALIFLPLLYIPVSIMISYSIHNQKRSRVFDIFVLLFVISVLYIRITA